MFLSHAPNSLKCFSLMIENIGSITELAITKVHLNDRKFWSISGRGEKMDLG